MRTPARNVPLRARLVGILEGPKEKTSAEVMPVAKAIRRIDLIYMLNKMYDAGVNLEKAMNVQRMEQSWLAGTQIYQRSNVRKFQMQL